jgi:hypothetical protein
MYAKIFLVLLCIFLVGEMTIEKNVPLASGIQSVADQSPPPYTSGYPTEFWPKPNATEVALDTNITIWYDGWLMIYELRLNPEVKINYPSKAGFNPPDEKWVYYQFAELLQPSTSYEATLSYRDEDNNLKKSTWSFTTTANSPSTAITVPLELIATVTIIAIIAIVIMFTIMLRRQKYKGATTTKTP